VTTLKQLYYHFPVHEAQTSKLSKQNQLDFDITNYCRKH